jgi:N-acetylglucosamine PTS system EIICBA or EIICB component
VTTADASVSKDRRRLNLAPLQKFGRSLMLPIAALPVAALLLRLGQPDLLGADGLGWDKVAAVIGAAGNAIFSNLPLLFALGVAIGMAKKADGSTALAAVVGYLVFKGVGDAMSPFVLGLPAKGATQDLINYGVLGGIVMGLTAAYLWQRYHRIGLPPYLAFFGGRRFVPIITSFAAIVISVLLSLVYKLFNSGLNSIGTWVTHNEVVGGFVYGTLNRLLIPVGLHHILNSGPWFIIGSYKGSDGVVYHGDIARFLHHDPTAGGFMSAALTSFLTGVTEPLEFAFMFVAWPLYVMHAVLTGTSLALVNALHIKDGFGFSAGLFDYVLNFNIATRPLWLVVIGLGYAVLYYFAFRFVIRRWNLRTPGREDEEDADSAIEADTRA